MDCEITRKLEIRDLGVIFTPNLNFRPYYLSVYNSASQTLGMISRNTKQFNDIKILKFFLIHSIDLKQYVFNVNVHQYPQRAYPYIELCKEFNVTTLQNRRALIKCKFIYTLINNLIDSLQLIESLDFKIPRFNDKFNEPFVSTLTSTSASYHSPLHRMTVLFYRNFLNNTEIDFYNSTLLNFNNYLKHLFLSLTYV